MKFVIFLKADRDSEAGVLPSLEAMENVGRFNEELANDGMLLAAEGLRPTSKATRLTFDEARPTVTDGPFAETKELVAGFWIVEGTSPEDVVERFAHAPFARGTTVEIRQVFQPEDFAGLVTPEQTARHEQITLDHLKA